jgi:hypothetical protein
MERKVVETQGTPHVRTTSTYIPTSPSFSGRRCAMPRLFLLLSGATALLQTYRGSHAAGKVEETYLIKFLPDYFSGRENLSCLSVDPGRLDIFVRFVTTNLQSVMFSRLDNKNLQEVSIFIWLIKHRKQKECKSLDAFELGYLVVDLLYAAQATKRGSLIPLS